MIERQANNEMKQPYLRNHNGEMRCDRRSWSIDIVSQVALRYVECSLISPIQHAGSLIYSQSRRTINSQSALLHP